MKAVIEMTEVELNKKFVSLKAPYYDIIETTLENLSQKELREYIDKIIKLINDYVFIQGEAHELKGKKKGKDLESANTLFSNCDIFISHLNPKLSKASFLLNQKIDKSSVHRDFLLLIFSILLSVLISVFLPTIQSFLGQNPNIKIENDLENIKVLLIKNLEINNEIKKSLDVLDSNISKFDFVDVNKKSHRISKSFDNNKTNFDSLAPGVLKSNSKFYKK